SHAESRTSKAITRLGSRSRDGRGPFPCASRESGNSLVKFGDDGSLVLLRVTAQLRQFTTSPAAPLQLGGSLVVLSANERGCSEFFSTGDPRGWPISRIE